MKDLPLIFSCVSPIDQIFLTPSESERKLLFQQLLALGTVTIWIFHHKSDSMDLKFAGKTVLITGSAGDIGRDTAASFLKQGANVVLHYNRSKQDIESILKEFVFQN